MKRVVLRILTALTLCLALLPVTALAEEERSYLALGDSITTGYRLGEGESSFVDILAAEGGYTVTNEAINGNTASGILEQLAGNALDEAIAGADLITITCGGNDMMAVFYDQAAQAYNAAHEEQITAMDAVMIMLDAGDSRWMPLVLRSQAVLNGSAADGTPALADSAAFDEALARFIDQLNQIVTYIRALNPEAAVVVTTQYNPYESFTGLFTVVRTGFGDGARKLSEAIAANAAAGGYLVADVYTAFAESTENLCNASTAPLDLDFHPNAAGHAVIAACIRTALDSRAGLAMDVLQACWEALAAAGGRLCQVLGGLLRV